ncbi:hypothetical protein IPN35_03520 [Candidatus Peregrinibacteria bacterium]|nr:MAG: hypothetical protein IPN35_03520 [Candidatus Peregrinibacteria bacterium]
MLKENFDDNASCDAPSGNELPDVAKGVLQRIKEKLKELWLYAIDDTCGGKKISLSSLNNTEAEKNPFHEDPLAPFFGVIKGEGEDKVAHLARLSTKNYGGVAQRIRAMTRENMFR